MSEMTLWAIDDTIAQLMALREEPDISDDERSAIDGQIEEWIGRELKKFDSCYGYIRHEEQQAAIAKQVWQEAMKWQHTHENRAIRVRELVKTAMERRELKRVEGPVGSFTVRGNGGVRRLDIEQEAIVPERYRRYKFELSSDEWLDLKSTLQIAGCSNMLRGLLSCVKSEIDNMAVRAALGAGIEVPGAKLAESGTSLVVK